MTSCGSNGASVDVPVASADPTSPTRLVSHQENGCARPVLHAISTCLSDRGLRARAAATNLPGVAHVQADAAWARLTSPRGFALSPPQLRPGTPYEVRAASGEHFAGAAELFAPPFEMAGTVPALDDGVFRLATYRAAGKTGITVWLAKWGAVSQPLADFATNAQEVLDRLFAQ